MQYIVNNQQDIDYAMVKANILLVDLAKMAILFHLWACNNPNFHIEIKFYTLAAAFMKQI